jgi:probable rRNA maturation factor
MPDTPHRRSGLRIALTNEAGRRRRTPASLAPWLQRVAPASAVGDMTIALVDDETMRRFNRRFAGKNRATDVLSFPSADGPDAGVARTAVPRGFGPAGHGRFLGDVVIATGVARRQAKAAGHRYADELKVLALHGLLHLLGYDHHADDGQMARLEARLRRRGGLSAGLIERAEVEL